MNALFHRLFSHPRQLMVLAMLLSFLLRGERITRVQGIACILILFGVGIGQRRQPMLEPPEA